MVAIAADRLAALLAGFPSFRRAELVRGSLLVGSPTTFGGNRTLPFVAHAGKAAAVVSAAARP
jgi:hypothetical protein